MKHRILIAEDTKDSLDFAAAALRDVGEIQTAPDGRKALAYYHVHHGGERPFDLVILDVAMPGMNGFEVAEAIRASGDKATPIALLTAYAEPETVGRAKRSNSVVWAKPILSDDLVAKVKGILNQC